MIKVVFLENVNQPKQTEDCALCFEPSLSFDSKNVQEKKFKVRHLCTNFDKNKIVEQYQFTPTTIGMSEKDFKK